MYCIINPDSTASALGQQKATQILQKIQKWPTVKKYSNFQVSCRSQQLDSRGQTISVKIARKSSSFTNYRHNSPANTRNKPSRYTQAMSDQDLSKLKVRNHQVRLQNENVWAFCLFTFDFRSPNCARCWRKRVYRAPVTNRNSSRGSRPTFQKAAASWMRMTCWG